MSLVGDALRRARAEAGERRGVAVPSGFGPPIRRSLLGGPVALVFALVVVAGGAALLTWWLVGGSDDTPAMVEAVQATNASEAGSSELPARGKGPSTSEPSTPGSPPAPQLAAGASEPPAVATAPAGDIAVPTLPVLPPEAAERTLPRTQGVDETTATVKPRINPTPVSGTTATREFVIDAELGYARLHLDYLVYKPSAPFARINGRDVIIGSVVDGFRVEEIGPDFVRLADPRGPLTLRVR